MQCATVNKRNDRAFPIPPTVHSSYTQLPTTCYLLTHISALLVHLILVLADRVVMDLSTLLLAVVEQDVTAALAGVCGSGVAVGVSMSPPLPPWRLGVYQ